MIRLRWAAEELSRPKDPGGSPYPKVLNQRGMKKLLEANGWVETVGGKHVVKMEKPGIDR